MRAVFKLLIAIGLVTLASPIVTLIGRDLWGPRPVFVVVGLLGVTGAIALWRPLPWINLGSRWRAVAACCPPAWRARSGPAW